MSSASPVWRGLWHGGVVDIPPNPADTEAWRKTRGLEKNAPGCCLSVKQPDDGEADAVETKMVETAAYVCLKTVKVRQGPLPSNYF